MSTAHASLRLKGLWAQLGPLGRIALGSAALGALILLLSSRSLLSAIFIPAAGGSNAADTDQKQREERFKLAFENQLAQINGRSLFFIPPAPRRPDAPPGPDPGPSAPTSYGGPTLIGFANGAAYFADGRRLTPGEKTEGTLRVKTITPPWSAVVEWEGVEFTISLFDHDRVVYPNATAAAPEHNAPEATRAGNPALTAVESTPPASAEAKPAPSRRPAPGPGGDPPPPPPVPTPNPTAEPR